MRRKKWTTPQLVVLVRGKLEEGVLASCRYINRLTGVGGRNFNCSSVARTVCSNCSSNAGTS
jgi:hypothetical protein